MVIERGSPVPIAQSETYSQGFIGQRDGACVFSGRGVGHGQAIECSDAHHGVRFRGEIQTTLSMGDGLLALAGMSGQDTQYVVSLGKRRGIIETGAGLQCTLRQFQRVLVIAGLLCHKTPTCQNPTLPRLIERSIVKRRFIASLGQIQTPQTMMQVAEFAL